MREYNERGKRIWPAEGNQDKIRYIPGDPEEIAKNQVEIRAEWEAELQEAQDELAEAPVEEMDFHLRNIAAIQERLDSLSEAEKAINARRERRD